MLVPLRIFQGWTSLLSSFHGPGPGCSKGMCRDQRLERAAPLQTSAPGAGVGRYEGAWRPLAVRLGRPRLGSWRSGARWG